MSSLPLLFFYLGFALIAFFSKALAPLVGFQASRRVYLSFLVMLLGFPLFQALLPVQRPWVAPVQIFSSPGGPRLQLQTMASAPTWSLPTPAPSADFSFDQIFWGLSFCGFVIFLLRFGKTQMALEKLKARSVLYKQRGALRIYFGPEIRSPFSAGRADVFLPVALSAQQLNHSLGHELEHLRRYDLLWTLLQDLTLDLFFYLPGRSLFRKMGEEIFELACDEAVLTKTKIKALDYGKTLVNLATTEDSNLQLVGSAGMGASHRQLKRRLKMILHKPCHKQRNSWLATLVGVLLIGTAAFASSGLVKDHVMNLSQLKSLVAKTQVKSEVPLVINQEVLTALNRAVGTPRSRLYIRQSLQRMTAYEAMIKAQLKARQFPEALLGLVMAESGFQNIDNGHSAGLWQMIPDTARAMGLTVEDKLDERFNAEKETEAALKYLAKNYSEFQDWHLTIIAYNSGEARLRDAIENAGHRNAFQLLREGYLSEETRKYLPQVMAAMIIYFNPDLAND